MFVISNNKTNLPLKIWLPDESYIEESCLEQAYNLATLPFIHKWISLMPDTHTGMGVPIGGVVPTTGIIIPNAVGVDIGCGMAFCQTDIKVSEIKDIQTGNGNLIQAVIGDILRNVPVGFNKYKKIKPCETLDKAYREMEKYEKYSNITDNFENAYFQVGTLGGGNHFIELQEDEEGFLAIMIHSGSRYLGKEICDTFNKIAKELNSKFYSSVPESSKLAFLPTDFKEGIDYINFMNLALDYAHENRAKMLIEVKRILETWVNKYTTLKINYSLEINCHHNYASQEHHYNKNVWVHRKGATRAREGELIAIPGAMGSYSYIAMGLGNEQSFHSSSHGAGRKFSRKGAMENFTTEEVMLDLKEKGVILGKQNKNDVAEESRFAYKNIDEVMENQKDLVKPVKKLRSIGVVKG